MKIKHLFVFGLLVTVTLSGCLQGNSGLNGLASPDEVSIAPAQTADLIEIAEGSATNAQNVSFSAGETQPPLDTPKPTQSSEPTVTAAPTQKQGKSAVRETTAPTPKATSKPTITPKPTATPRPTVTPTPIATPRPTAAPMPTAFPTPIPTSTPTPMPTAPIVVIASEPPTARTICNTCGADITGNVPAHGDSHLLNGENFSYRVE